MLDTDPPDLVGARRTAARSLRDGNRAAETIRRLRGLFGSQTPAIEPFDLNEVVREVLTLAGNELQSKNILTGSSLVYGLPLASGDRIQVQQVVLNILLNAIDAVQAATAGPRTIRIATGVHGDDEVRVDVADTGCGIETHNSERLFEPFYTTKQNGMGVGLSVSKAIIDSVGGQIWATANAGGGATFSFTLRRGTNPGGKLTRNPPTSSSSYRIS
jgi:C4-dicarboxylate-specific signal transduction histidine kinase